MTAKGYNKLSAKEDFSAVIPTRMPRVGEPTRTVPLFIALEIADEFYSLYSIGGRNAEYCRRKYQEARRGMV